MAKKSHFKLTASGSKIIQPAASNSLCNKFKESWHWAFSPLDGDNGESGKLEGMALSPPVEKLDVFPGLGCTYF